MIVRNYGLFWRRDEIVWKPGTGIKNSFRLLGRIGENKPGIRVANFRMQQGIYILYDEYGPCYVGLTKKQGLGKRLRDHVEDHLFSSWQRFSWFGFQKVLDTSDETGLSPLADIEIEVTGNTATSIGDVEALLIRVLNPKLNNQQMKFKDAKEWTQVEKDRCSYYLEKCR